MDKAKEEISLIGRIFSLEVLLIVMGVLSIVSGIVNGKGMQIFWGGVIIGGSLLFLLVRKRRFRNK